MTHTTTHRPITVTDDTDTGELIFGHRHGAPVGYRLYDGDRLRSGAIIGRAGTGKTTLLNGIADAVTATGDTRVWTGGSDDEGQVRGMLRETLALMSYRDASYREDTASERPGVLVLLDDADRLLDDDEIGGMVRTIAASGSWARVGVLAAVSSATSLHINDLARLMYHQYVLLGDPTDHRWSMPTGQAASEPPFDGHLVLADDFMPLTATPFAFNWQS